MRVSVFLCELSKRSCQFRISSDKVRVEVYKAKKDLNLFNKLRDLLFSDSDNLSRVYYDTISDNKQV